MRRWWRKIRETKPEVVFAPHVETSAGIILPDDYITAMAAAAHEVGALLVLDCIASGLYLGGYGGDRRGCADLGPAKGLVGLALRRAGDAVGARRRRGLAATTSNSFALDLKKWRSIMAAYEGGGHAYHATMPTDALVGFRDAMRETKAMGFAAAKEAQWAAWATAVRAMLADKGVTSVAAPRLWRAGGCGQSIPMIPDIQNGKKFAAEGMQIAAGVPLQVGEGAEFNTFRIGPVRAGQAV